ncbi:Gfo/Idh/MocA family protein [Lacticaseibacillus camelliae]|uniref:Oxidoreductase domain-containing protein n=2 Tax=Lacticaseibacillus camelliae TaxID=381742 RepID=A0A0R2FC98_9LACO|nr:Gfo/Idh/MocA family oxidoreductase [Lacticaseibacillus camelliae]KRN22684.1 oxidoreductase domain-containing protein [Lacticaseibacillus camelliae DSM 22697 = JCM 13995]
MINFGIIGCGHIAAVHAAALAALADAQLVACCDIDPLKGEAYAKANHCRYYSQASELIKDPEVRVVTIATPHYLHASMSIQALQAGKDVLCEKPMATTLADAKAVVAAYRTSKGTYTVVYQNRFNPVNVQLKAALQNKEFGPLLGVKAQMTWHRDAAYYTSTDWKGTWQYEGGGVLMNQAIHTLDEIYWLAGMPTRIKGKIMTSLLESVIEVEDNAMATAVLPGGTPIVFFASNSFIKDPPPIVQLEFPDTTVQIDANTLRINDRVIQDAAPTLTIGKAAWGGSHQRMIEAVVNRIMHVDDPLLDHLAGADGLASLSMVLGIYESDKSGKWVTLPAISEVAK